MGIHPNVSATNFPKQGNWLNQRVNVIFHYDDRVSIEGTIMRDDMESPYLTIIRLDNNKYVLSTECQFQLNMLRGKKYDIKS